MSGQFWTIAITMSIVAIAFITRLPSKTKWQSQRALAATVVAIPVFSIAFYIGSGSPGAIDAKNTHQNLRSNAMSASAISQRQPVGSVDSLLSGLKNKLDKNPDDAGNWLLLAKSYDHLNRKEEAIAAYVQARSLGRKDDNLAMALGVVDEQLGDSQANHLPGLRGRIELSDMAREIVSPDDTVFIFAKESVNQRMPLVAVRKSIRDLPYEFNLTDADAMIAGTSLADYESLVVTAKVSRTGMAAEGMQGLGALVEDVSPLTGQQINLVISSIVGDSGQFGNAND